MADVLALSTKVLQYIWLYLRNFALNTLRRLRLLLLKAQGFWQQRRLRRQYRLLGENIFTLYQAGDLNPLLHELVKDQFELLKNLSAARTALQEKIGQVRELIRTTSYSLSLSAAASPSQSADPE
jgi:hypothetical protein